MPSCYHAVLDSLEKSHVRGLWLSLDIPLARPDARSLIVGNIHCRLPDTIHYFVEARATPFKTN